MRRGGVVVSSVSDCKVALHVMSPAKGVDPAAILSADTTAESRAQADSVVKAILLGIVLVPVFAAFVVLSVFSGATSSGTGRRARKPGRARNTIESQDAYARSRREWTMPYDLVIKNGVLIDGSGLPRYRADVAVHNGRIAATGRIRAPAHEVIDADGLVVTPGFIDGHTHMDAQVFWDPLGTCSCYHGVTSVVMGNCGFSLAPCSASAKHLVVRNLQRAEDISLDAMEAGIEWKWTTFPEFLDRLDALPKGINYSSYIGHCALRTYAMGERAFEQAATEDDLRAMEKELRAAIGAGAIGFTTSRSPLHETPDAKPVASRLATWDEVRRLVGAMGEMNPVTSNETASGRAENRRVNLKILVNKGVAGS